MAQSNALNILGAINSGPKNYSPVSTSSLVSNTNGAAKNYSPAPAAITHPTVTAPVASQTSVHPDGTTMTTKYIAPTDVKGTTSSTSPQPSESYTPPASATPIPPKTSFQQGVGGLMGYGTGQNNNPTVNQANSGLLNIGNGESPEIQAARQRILNLEQSQAKATAGIESTPEPIEQMQGQAGVQQRLYSGLLGAAQSNYSNALAEQSARSGALSAAGGLGTSQQGQNIGALGTGTSYASPSFQGYGSGRYVSPLGENVPNQTDQYGNGPEAASNVQSIKDYTTQLNNIDSQLPSVQPTIDSLNKYAISGGLNNDAPFISALQQKLGTTFSNDPAVSGTLQKINTLNSLYQQITGIPGTLDPNKMTVNQLQTTSKAMLQDINNKRKAIQNAKDKLNTSSTSSNSGSSNGSTSLQTNPNGTLKAVSF